MDRQDVTLISLWVHVPVVVVWIGLVMLDAIAAFAPGLTAEQRARLLTWSRAFVVVAVPVILATGIWQTVENPFFRVESYSGLSELRQRTLYGDLLFWKHGAVLATFGLTLLVRFLLAPRLALAAATPGADPRTLRLVQMASVLNLIACLAALMLATRMVVELH